MFLFGHEAILVQNFRCVMLCGTRNITVASRHRKVSTICSGGGVVQEFKWETALLWYAYVWAAYNKTCKVHTCHFKHFPDEHSKVCIILSKWVFRACKVLSFLFETPTPFAHTRSSRLELQVCSITIHGAFKCQRRSLSR